MIEISKLRRTNSYNIITLIKEFIFPARKVILEHETRINELYILLTEANYTRVADEESLHVETQYFANLKDKEPWFDNDILPVRLSKYTGPSRPNVPRIYAKWDNGFSAVVKRSGLNLYKLKN